MADLNREQIKVLSNLLERFQHVITSLPGCSDTIDYNIELQMSEPVNG